MRSNHKRYKHRKCSETIVAADRTDNRTAGSGPERGLFCGKRAVKEDGSRRKMYGRAYPYGMVWALVLAVCIVLCGCTRREQLVFETGAVAQEGNAPGVLSGGISEGAADAQSGPDAAGAQNTGAGEADAAGVQEPTDRQGGTAGMTDPALLQSVGALPQQSGTAAICVHVCGAVKNPDVYEIPAGSRVHDAVEKAGGFTEDADESYVNQAQTLCDGVKLVIPTRAQTELLAADNHAGILTDVPGGVESADGQGSVTARQTGQAFGILDSRPEESASNAGTPGADGRIDINTASETELCNIPGIGATRAAAIVAYRKEHGGFSSVEEIMNVSGIKEGTYAKIKDSIKVD